MTANAVLLAASHLIVLGIIVVCVEGALVDAHLALDALLRISLNDKFWRQIGLHLIFSYLLMGIPFAAK
jgi:hypothetical protein